MSRAIVKYELHSELNEAVSVQLVNMYAGPIQSSLSRSLTLDLKPIHDNRNFITNLTEY